MSDEVTVKDFAKYLNVLISQGKADWPIQVRVWQHNTCVPISDVEERPGANIIEIYHEGP